MSTSYIRCIEQATRLERRFVSAMRNLPYSCMGYLAATRGPGRWLLVLRSASDFPISTECWGADTSCMPEVSTLAVLDEWQANAVVDLRHTS